jgi:hypothetical protein
MYLSRHRSLNKHMASLDHKRSNIDLPSQIVIFMKCCKKLTGMLSWF